MTPAETKAIETIRPYVLANVKAGHDLMTAIVLAFQQVTEFAAEMAQGVTERAKLARQALTIQVWTEIQTQTTAAAARKSVKKLFA